MLFYQVKPEHDQKTLYKWNRGHSVPVRYLVGGELYTPAEVARLSIYPDYLRAVNVSRNKVYTCFGARFASAEDITPAPRPALEGSKKYSAPRFFDKVLREFDNLFGASPFMQEAEDGIYISREGYNCFYLPASAPVDGSRVRSRSIKGGYSMQEYFKNAVAEAVVAASEVVVGLERAYRCSPRREIVRYSVPGCAPVYFNKAVLKGIPKAAKMLFAAVDPYKKPAVAVLPGENGEAVPVAIVLPLLVSENDFTPAVEDYSELAVAEVKA